MHFAYFLHSQRTLCLTLLLISGQRDFLDSWFVLVKSYYLSSLRESDDHSCFNGHHKIIMFTVKLACINFVLKATNFIL